MNNLQNIVLNYFTPPNQHFWRWSESGEAIEWLHGGTICYTADLMNILRGLADTGLPPLGTVLILMAACQERRDQDNIDAYIGQLAEVSETQFGRAFRVHPLARTMLGLVQALPPDLRTGSSRIHLIHEISNLEAVKSRAIEVPPQQTLAVLDEFSSGRHDHAIFRNFKKPAQQFLLIEIVPLAFAKHKFPNAETLEHHLRTGVVPPPEPLELPFPEPAPLDLLDELEDDPKTKGLARLARRLLAALNIPMHARGASDLPIGGVADIANRGDFDRLLLSELAQDDLTLTARLVNSEALFLRREEPPANLDRQRTILMDTTLKMWGTQRVFALSAALAFARNSAHVTAIQAFALGGSQYETLDLKNKAGVMAALEQLDSALHCGSALSSFFEQNPKKEYEDIVLVSDADAMRDEHFQAVLSEIRERLRFLVMLHRDGSLQFFEFVKGRGKLIGKPKFDLDELLFPRTKTPDRPAASTGQANLPAFFQQTVSPLFFPLTAVKLTRENAYFEKDHGAVVVTDHQRVLYWPNDRHGALEVVPFIEPGKYCIGFGDHSNVFILVQNNASMQLILYRLDITGIKNRIELEAGVENIHAMAYDQQKFYVQTPAGTRIYDALTGQKNDITLDSAAAFTNYQRRKNSLYIFGIKQFIQHNYSTIQRAKSIYITKDGQLALDNHRLSLLDQDQMKWTADGSPEPRNVEAGTLSDNPQTILYERYWPNGSRAIADSRGFLHLIPPADTRLPEVTIVLIADTITAAWASDGRACGNKHFINTMIVKLLPVAEFYEQYLKTFIL